jgi:hypothetical protein
MNFFGLVPAACAFLACVAALGAIAPVAAHAMADTPESRWEIDYGATKCRLIRHFTTAGQGYRLEVDRGWTLGGFNWGLYGSALPVYSSTASIEIELGAGRRHRVEADSYVAKTGDEGAIRWNDPDGVVFDALREGGLGRLTGPQKLDVSPSLPNVGAAIEALEACENDLLASWGFDADRSRSLAIRPRPAGDPGKWVTRGDYPFHDAVNNNEGMTTFLLTIGADGAPTGCRIIDSSGFPSLDAKTCELLMARAAFLPAEDSEGRSVQSFYINRFWWQASR